MINACLTARVLQASGGKVPLVSFVPNGLLVFLSSVFVSFEKSLFQTGPTTQVPPSIRLAEECRQSRFSNELLISLFFSFKNQYNYKNKRVQELNRVQEQGLLASVNTATILTKPDRIHLGADVCATRFRMTLADQFTVEQI
jgi:hypothetical protein